MDSRSVHERLPPKGVPTVLLDCVERLRWIRLVASESRTWPSCQLKTQFLEQLLAFQEGSTIPSEKDMETLKESLRVAKEKIADLSADLRDAEQNASLDGVKPSGPRGKVTLAVAVLMALLGFIVRGFLGDRL